MPSSSLPVRSLRHALLLVVLLVFASALPAHARGWLRRNRGHSAPEPGNEDDSGGPGGDGWVPGSGLRLTGCLLRNCGSELRACRRDTVCRAALGCSIGVGTLFFWD
jgi:hypothetical protein